MQQTDQAFRESCWRAAVASFRRWESSQGQMCNACFAKLSPCMRHTEFPWSWSSGKQGRSGVNIFQPISQHLSFCLPMCTLDTLRRKLVLLKVFLQVIVRAWRWPTFWTELASIRPQVLKTDIWEAKKAASSVSWLHWQKSWHIFLIQETSPVLPSLAAPAKRSNRRSWIVPGGAFSCSKSCICWSRVCTAALMSSLKMCSWRSALTTAAWVCSARNVYSKLKPDRRYHESLELFWQACYPAVKLSTAWHREMAPVLLLWS